METSEADSDLGPDFHLSFSHPTQFFPGFCKYTKVTRGELGLCFTDGERLFNRSWLLRGRGEGKKKSFLSLISYKLYFLEMPFAYIYLYEYVCTYLSVYLVIYLPTCMPLYTWRLTLAHHCLMVRHYDHCIPVIRVLAILLRNIIGELWNTVVPEEFLEHTVYLECQNGPWRYAD